MISIISSDNKKFDIDECDLIRYSDFFKLGLRSGKFKDEKTYILEDFSSKSVDKFIKFAKNDGFLEILEYNDELERLGEYLAANKFLFSLYYQAEGYKYVNMIKILKQIYSFSVDYTPYQRKSKYTIPKTNVETSGKFIFPYQEDEKNVLKYYISYLYDKYRDYDTFKTEIDKEIIYWITLFKEHVHRIVSHSKVLYGPFEEGELESDIDNYFQIEKLIEVINDEGLADFLDLFLNDKLSTSKQRVAAKFKKEDEMHQKEIREYNEKRKIAEKKSKHKKN